MRNLLQVQVLITFTYIVFTEMSLALLVCCNYSTDWFCLGNCYKPWLNWWQSLKKKFSMTVFVFLDILWKKEITFPETPYHIKSHNLQYYTNFIFSTNLWWWVQHDGFKEIIWKYKYFMLQSLQLFFWRPWLQL